MAHINKHRMRTNADFIVCSFLISKKWVTTSIINQRITFRNRLPFFFCHHIIAHHGYYFGRSNVYQTLHLRNHLENCFEQNYLKTDFTAFFLPSSISFIHYFLKLPDVGTFFDAQNEVITTLDVVKKRCYDDTKKTGNRYLMISLVQHRCISVTFCAQ